MNPRDQWVIEAVLPDDAKPFRLSHYVDGVEIRHSGVGVSRAGFAFVAE